MRGFGTVSVFLRVKKVWSTFLHSLAFCNSKLVDSDCEVKCSALIADSPSKFNLPNLSWKFQTLAMNDEGSSISLGYTSIFKPRIITLKMSWLWWHRGMMTPANSTATPSPASLLLWMRLRKYMIFCFWIMWTVKWVLLSSVTQLGAYLNDDWIGKEQIWLSLTETADLLLQQLISDC